MKNVRFLALFAVAILVLALSGCKHENIYSHPESVSVSTNLVEFSLSGGETTIGLDSNRDWATKIKYKGGSSGWLVVNPALGAASYDTNVLRISASPNDGADRTADIVISTGYKVVTIVVNQRGTQE